MKKILSILLLLFVVSCMKDPIDDYQMIVDIPEKLQIVEPVGLKLESTFVTNKVSINAKFKTSGTYRIKLIDISGKVVSHEKITAESGDNLLNVYTTSLEKSSYRVQLLDEFNNLLGTESFVMVN